jgi:hypothetical protein
MRTEYFKHAAHSPFFSFQNAVCLIILLFLVHVLFTFYIQGVLKFKNKFGSLRVNSGAVQWVKKVFTRGETVWGAEANRLCGSSAVVKKE